MNGKHNRFTVAFYNLENLFDTKDDPDTLDDDFTPEGSLSWNEYRYQMKLNMIARTLTQIGYAEAGRPPALIGLAEVENKRVLQDLLKTASLTKYDYEPVHYDSPDERGIDCALLYRRSAFELISSTSYPLLLHNETGERDYTRDILYVHGNLFGMKVHLLINHWPSRRAGEEETKHKRMQAAHRNREIMNAIQQADPDPRLLIMGDFNDNPQSESVQHLLGTDLYNPMDLLLTRYEGSLNHRFTWHLFDQILLSKHWMKPYANPLHFQEADVYNPKPLQEYEGKYKGNPFRTYAGLEYLGGASDHFPVFVLFRQELS
ncbi:endonuclease/exonuclease/phosphatase family protein [Croceiramulus getboli]|nr:endonuclease [Flavobacteriaceae bacterium YJPT1-3]